MKKQFLILLSALFVIFNSSSVFACTVFNATKGDLTLVGNSEDLARRDQAGRNLSVKVWFTPLGEGNYGTMFFGYEDFWEQAGASNLCQC